jgi:hypothetical protein
LKKTLDFFGEVYYSIEESRGESAQNPGFYQKALFDIHKRMPWLLCNLHKRIVSRMFDLPEPSKTKRALSEKILWMPWAFAKKFR